MRDEPGGNPGRYPGYRLCLALVIAALFALQKYITVQKPYLLARLLGVNDLQLVRKWLGVVVSVLFVAALVEFAWAFLPRLCQRRRWTWPRVERSYEFRAASFYVAASLFFLADLHRPFLCRWLVLTFPTPPLAIGLTLMGVWGVLLAGTRGLSGSQRDLVRFGFLLIVTRAVLYAYTPFDKVYGDMLRAIDRSLDLMLAGSFPYIDSPAPAMPYWPLTFLAYLPPKLAGLDLRLSNLVIELATVGVALSFGIDRRVPPIQTIAARFALPLLMLLRNWTYYSETQFAMSVLCALLFARAVSSKGGVTQAVTLGAAVAANQTMGILGPLILPFWIKRYGLKNAALYTTLSLSTCLALISPFLAWNGREFLRVSFFSLGSFSEAELIGQFSLRPLVEGLFPHAAMILIGTTVVVVGALNAIQTDRARVAAATAIGYGLFLLLLHRTFSHYYLPVIAMIVGLNYERMVADAAVPATIFRRRARNARGSQVSAAETSVGESV